MGLPLNTRLISVPKQTLFVLVAIVPVGSGLTVRLVVLSDAPLLEQSVASVILVSV